MDEHNVTYVTQHCDHVYGIYINNFTIVYLICIHTNFHEPVYILIVIADKKLIQFLISNQNCFKDFFVRMNFTKSPMCDFKITGYKWLFCSKKLCAYTCSLHTFYFRILRISYKSCRVKTKTARTCLPHLFHITDVISMFLMVMCVFSYVILRIYK